MNQTFYSKTATMMSISFLMGISAMVVNADQTVTITNPTAPVTIQPAPNQVVTIQHTDPVKIAPSSSGFSGNTVYVGGTPILRVRFSSAGFTPQERAAQIQQRVNALMDGGPIHPEDIYVQDYDALDSGIYVKGHLLFMADSATARFNQTTAHDLAVNWAANMRRMLPKLTSEQPTQ